jgi:hypothetical protein
VRESLPEEVSGHILGDTPGRRRPADDVGELIHHPPYGTVRGETNARPRRWQAESPRLG